MEPGLGIHEHRIALAELNCMRRSFETEILERDDVPEVEALAVYSDLTRIHRILGDTALIVGEIRRDPLPVTRILDIGCGRGGVLREIRNRLGIDVVGVDLRAPAHTGMPFKIHRANAIVDPLPVADIAFSMYLGHHLSESDLMRLISNVGRSCRRFILLDLVRHALPLALFRLFLAPLLSPIAAADGAVSIRRSYTPSELCRIANAALAETGAQFRHSIASLYIRQTLDISYPESWPPSHTNCR